MNREIKFRAWEVNLKKMIDLHKLTPLATTIETHDGLYLPFVENLILMQFTGLTDKNGKEIYEGDILQFEFKGKKEISVIKEHNHDGRGYCWWMSLPFGQRPFEIIGNIYENPDLLKEEK